MDPDLVARPGAGSSHDEATFDFSSPGMSAGAGLAAPPAAPPGKSKLNISTRRALAAGYARSVLANTARTSRDIQDFEVHSALMTWPVKKSTDRKNCTPEGDRWVQSEPHWRSYDSCR